METSTDASHSWCRIAILVKQSIVEYAHWKNRIHYLVAKKVRRYRRADSTDYLEETEVTVPPVLQK